MKHEFVVEKAGKQFVLYAGLLDEAHAQGLISIVTKLIQVPSEENGNTAICTAEVTIDKDGKVRMFADVGDASPANVSKMMIPHLIRMAATRAKARALRDAVNASATALEETEDEEPPVTQARTTQSRVPAPAARASQPAAPKVAQATAPAPSAAASQPKPQPTKVASAATSTSARPAQGAQDKPPVYASPAQTRAITSIAEKLGWNDDMLMAHVEETYGVNSLVNLPQQDASRLIEHLNDLQRTPRAFRP